MAIDKYIITDRIREANLKATNIRTDVMQLFYENKQALSYADINKYLLKKEDKATIYRTLKSFSEKGIIHEIFDGDKTTKYALCGKKCNTNKHHDSHAHFKCSDCKNVYCLEKPEITINVPNGYITNTFNLIVEGTCTNCS
jgi:Fur family ferric uptake transcriptional regulator|tara:strand:- start:2550 stop:2972 length:423 start_codon:yes stop_codon:yes gene_type:complete